MKILVNVCLFFNVSYCIAASPAPPQPAVAAPVTEGQNQYGDDDSPSNTAGGAVTLPAPTQLESNPAINTQRTMTTPTPPLAFQSQSPQTPPPPPPLPSSDGLGAAVPQTGPIQPIYFPNPSPAAVDVNKQIAAGDSAGAWASVEKALKKDPDNLQLKELENLLAQHVVPSSSFTDFIAKAVPFMTPKFTETTFDFISADKPTKLHYTTASNDHWDGSQETAAHNVYAPASKAFSPSSTGGQFDAAADVRGIEALLASGEKMSANTKKELLEVLASDKRIVISQQLNDLFHASARQIRAGNFAAAENYADSAIALNRKTAFLSKAAEADVYILRAKLRRKTGNIIGSAEDATAALALNPQNGEALLLRGEALLYLRNYRQALADAESLRVLEPRNAGSYALRGLAYGGLGMAAETTSNLKMAAMLDPQFTQLYHDSIVVAQAQQATPATSRASVIDAAALLGNTPLSTSQTIFYGLLTFFAVVIPGYFVMHYFGYRFFWED